MQRLPLHVIEFIKREDKKYSELIRNVWEKFGLQIGKSTVSYYKRSKPRTKDIDFSLVSQWEMEWLLGLYFADGSKFFEKQHYDYTIKLALDYKRDKDIVERVVKILQKMGLTPTISRQKGALIIRVFSKNLYGSFPSKTEFYKPKNILAFVSGLIDGDGCAAKWLGAFIVQYNHASLMSYLMKHLELSRYEQEGIRWGRKRKIITYYVPSKICKALIKEGYCIKLLRNLNRAQGPITTKVVGRAQHGRAADS